MNKNINSISQYIFQNELTDEINSILNDFTSGSQELNEKILKLFLKIKSKKSLVFLIQLFKENFSSFEIIQNNLSRLEKDLERKNISEIKKEIKKNLKSYEQRIEKLFKKIKKHIYVNAKILTISNSKTIFDVIKLLHQNDYQPEIFVLESRPGGEGKIFHKKLKSENIKSILIKDSQLEDTVKKVDFVLVGADRIYPDKWFLNKVKTKRLVRVARKNSIPVFILALKEKIQKEKDSRNKKLTTFRYDKNLFEKIELRLIDEIFLA